MDTFSVVLNSSLNFISLFLPHVEVKEPYLPPLSPFPSLRSISSSSESSEQLIEHRWWMGVDWWQITGRLIDTAVSLCPPSLPSPPPPAFLVTAQKSIKVQISLWRSHSLNSKILCRRWLPAVYNHILPIYLLQYVFLKKCFPIAEATAHTVPPLYSPAQQGRFVSAVLGKSVHFLSTPWLRTSSVFPVGLAGSHANPQPDSFKSFI